MFSLSLSCVASHVPYILEDLLLEVSWDSMKKSLQLCRLIEVKITMQIEFQLIFRNLFFDLQWFSKPVFFLVSEWVSDIFIIEFSSLMIHFYRFAHAQMLIGLKTWRCNIAEDSVGRTESGKGWRENWTCWSESPEQIPTQIARNCSYVALSTEKD